MKRILTLVLSTIMVLSLFLTVYAQDLPVGQPFSDIWDIKDINDIHSGVIVGADGKCADIEREDLEKWFNTYINFTYYDRVIAPKKGYILEDYYIKLWNKDKTEAYIIYNNSGVIVGEFGEPCKSHGEVKENYVWYLPYIGNARSALYTANTTLFQKYLNEKSDTFVNTLRDKAPDDEEIIPQNNLLNTDGASDWSRGEIQRSAACNLLPYELTQNYTKNITRKEFCDLIYRLIATEFSPVSDSRMGQWSAIDSVIYERGLTDKVNSISFSDCEDDKIKFLSGADIIYGMGDGTFAPDESITREQAATILYRTAQFLGNKTIPTSAKLPYADEREISNWAKTSVATMKVMDIMKGVSESEFAPKGTYTVEQAIATMVRLYECY